MIPPLDGTKEEAIAFYSSHYGVSEEIHTEDHIFNFIITHPVFTCDAARIEYYFRDGANSSRILTDLLQQYLSENQAPHVLEFASGYGCVSRHLKNNKNIDLTTCDIHPAAIEFIKHKLGIKSIQSSDKPELLVAAQNYDVVFALSFFSHMPFTTWERWLRRLVLLTNPGGLIIFTTQGIASGLHFGWPEISSSGFWYLPSSEQKDLSSEEYGQTIVTPKFVRGVISGMRDVELVSLSEGRWWGHQDLYILRRI